jgi:hypothetical protein
MSYNEKKYQGSGFSNYPTRYRLSVPLPRTLPFFSGFGNPDIGQRNIFSCPYELYPDYLSGMSVTGISYYLIIVNHLLRHTID